MHIIDKSIFNAKQTNPHLIIIASLLIERYFKTILTGFHLNWIIFMLISQILNQFTKKIKGPLLNSLGKPAIGTLLMSQ